MTAKTILQERLEVALTDSLPDWQPNAVVLGVVTLSAPLAFGTLVSSLDKGRFRVAFRGELWQYFPKLTLLERTPTAQSLIEIGSPGSGTMSACDSLFTRVSAE